MSKELSKRERELVKEMDGQRDSSDIGDILGLNPGTIRQYISNIREKGHIIEYTGDGYVYQGKAQKLKTREEDVGEGPVESRVLSQSKASKTRNVREKYNEMAAELNKLMNMVEIPNHDREPPTPYNEDLVIGLSDTHFGELKEDGNGNEVFNTEIAKKRVRKIFEKAHHIADTQPTTYESVNVLMLGDMVTNENIYSGQAHDIESTIDKQIKSAVETFYSEIKSLSKKFPHVQVVMTPGNHGEVRSDGSSSNANFDIIMYNQLISMISIDQEIDNVKTVLNNKTGYTNAFIRGHKIHIRHGENALEHIGTSAGKKRWMSWALSHDFDVAYRGHYHQFKYEPIHGHPVIMLGSIAPPGDFEESLGIDGRASAVVHGVSDRRPITSMFPMDFEEY